jgi:hypothetical protein
MSAIGAKQKSLARAQNVADDPTETLVPWNCCFAN